jgi:uncharacterized membrane protein YgdD (TMEM256/DUF423 family)
MKKNSKTFLLFGSAFGFLGVALGAFGAHGLKAVLSPDMLSVFETGVRYQMYHAFAILITAVLIEQFEIRQTVFAGWSFVAGIVLFSGSLYIVALTGIVSAGIITPFGGLAFLVGWFFLFLAAFKIKKEN